VLSGKRAVVTGSGQGIGKAIASALAAHGAKVIINDLNPETAAETVAEIRQAGAAAEAVIANVATFDGAKQVIDGCVDAFGGIDILVNNAGINRDRMIFNMSEAEWDSVIGVHLKGTFGCTRFASALMREQRGGRIINICSRSGLRGRIGQSNYAAAKAGILGFTITVAQEMAKYGVTVNAVVPRAFTEMVASIPEELRKQRDSAWSDSGVRLRGAPEDIAPLVVYLTSDDAAWVNGQAVGIGGDKLALWAHPKEIREAFSIGGWDPEKIKALLKASILREPESIGSTD
jgi:NAD(P)-dependent dehydrogenase (short-subunit alcohol dehydrogenase family)